VKSENYNNATIAYNSGDYIKALEGYYICLTEDVGSFEPGDSGLVYHRLGNCLVKVERYEEATQVYRKSLLDTNYVERGSIHVNLGTALFALGRNEEAIEAFQAALDDETYDAPYRAWMGMGNALTKLGRIVEAGTAYRTAALDPKNANPVKALMNLGASFSALNRPGDAVEAYLAILDFHVTGNTLNRTYERLGNAYFANGQYRDAIQAFQDAELGGNYHLSERSNTQLTQARLSLSSPMVAVALAEAQSEQAKRSDLEDSSVLQALDTEASVFAFGSEQPNEEDVNFFTATDDDLIAAGKRQIRQARRLQHTGLRILLVILVVAVLTLGTATIAFTQGYGWPSQKAVINGFFDSHAAGKEEAAYWLVPQNDNQWQLYRRMLQSVAEVDSSHVTYMSIDRSMEESEVTIAVKLDEGGIVHYRINMVRDDFSWKISGIFMVFASQE